MLTSVRLFILILPVKSTSKGHPDGFENYSISCFFSFSNWKAKQELSCCGEHPNNSAVCSSFVCFSLLST